MKNLSKIKILIILTILILLYTLISAISYSNAVSSNLSENIFRLHVIAASNSEEDQNLKYIVRDEILKYMNESKQYQKIDSRVLNGIVTTGKYVLDKINRIKGIIIKYPQNEKIIMLCKHLEELVDNYINEVDIASQSDFDYNQLPFVLNSTLEMRLIKSECSRLLYTDYLNILDKKEELQKQYRTYLEFDQFLIFIFSGPVLVVICKFVLINSSTKTFYNTLPFFLILYCFINRKALKVNFNSIKYRKEVKENKIKIKKLDRFIDTYYNWKK